MVLRIAHRGASGHVCENTLEAFNRAIELGVDMIELDVRHTKDNVPVVFHNRKLNRAADGKGKIKKMTFRQLRRFWQKNGEKILTIEEALAFINKRCNVNIELKGGFSRRIIDAIYVSGIQEDVIVSSFFKGPLMKVRKMCPNIKIGVLRKMGVSYSRIFKWCKELNAYSVHPYYTNRRLTKRTVRKFQRQGIQVYVWPVNKRKEIERMKRMGVDGIMSDYPERV